ncbi:MAG: hypothetical protein QM601_01940 [Pseudoxanthomonas sp.]
MKIVIALCLALGLLAVGIPLSRAISDEESASQHHQPPTGKDDGQAGKAAPASAKADPARH